MAQINIVNKAQVYDDNEKFRIESEFFTEDYIANYSKVKALNYCLLNSVISVLTDFHANGSYETIARNFVLLDKPGFAYMVRSTDLETQNYTDDVKYVTEHTYNFLNKSKVFGGELLINKIGTPGRAYLMPSLSRPVSLGMNLFMIRLKETSPLNNVFVWLFLNTSIGKKIINRKVNGTVPLTIDKAAIRSLPIPIPTPQFQETLIEIVAQSETLLHDAKSLYTNAEKTLLDAIGLNGFTPPASKFCVKGMAESFNASGRIDAEYYQNKYEKMLDCLTSIPCDKLGNIVSITKSIEPGSGFYGNDGVPFVRVSDITKFGIQEPDIKIPAHLTELRPHKNTILLSKDGSVGIAYKIEHDIDCITSGALLHLNVMRKDVLPDYLTLVLNSMVVQLQAERDAGGSIIQHWKPAEIAEVVIPIIKDDTQTEIAEQVQESFALRRQSEKLLDTAKRAVEIAIENGEDAAIKWFQHHRTQY